MVVRVKLHNAAFRELRTSAKMDREILKRAERVARRAGLEFKAELSPGRNRARAVVVPDTADAALETARDPHRLIAALDAGR